LINNNFSSKPDSKKIEFINKLYKIKNIEKVYPNLNLMNSDYSKENIYDQKDFITNLRKSKVKTI